MGRRPPTQAEVNRMANSQYSAEEQAYGAGRKMNELRQKGGCRSWMWILLILAAVAIWLITSGA